MFNEDLKNIFLPVLYVYYFCTEGVFHIQQYLTIKLSLITQKTKQKTFKQSCLKKLVLCSF